MLPKCEWTCYCDYWIETNCKDFQATRFKSREKKHNSSETKSDIHYRHKPRIFCWKQNYMRSRICGGLFFVASASTLIFRSHTTQILKEFNLWNTSISWWIQWTPIRLSFQLWPIRKFTYHFPQVHNLQILSKN